MHRTGDLRDRLEKVMHKKRVDTLLLMVEGAMEKKTLSLTSLGRALDVAAQERSNIQRSNRFLGNEHVQAECGSVYAILSDLLIGKSKRPVLLVDWSNIPNTTHHTIRAALVGDGRALSIYEEVHPETLQGNAKVHRRFLRKLRSLLPEGVCPIVITDAGFHAPWFAEVRALGWDYVGRLRGGKYYFVRDAWYLYPTLERPITTTPRYVGEVLLNKTKKGNQMPTHLYVVRQTIRSRKNKRRYFDKVSCEHRASAHEPWFVVSSLQCAGQNAKRVIKLYALRMQIEEAFRDLKDPHHGFAMRHARSKNITRINVLLMIAALASALLYLIGSAAEKLQWHRHFQSSSSTKKRVLSLFYLGHRVLLKKLLIPPKSLQKALSTLHSLHKNYLCYQ